MNNSSQEYRNLYSRFFRSDPGDTSLVQRITCDVGVPESGISVHRDRNGIDLIHKSGDPETVNRLIISCGDTSVEWLPSKGLSVGEAWYKEVPFFWEPTLEKLPSPDEVDPDRTLLVNGEAVEGLGFLEGFTGGVELLGLDNWGMPYRDEPAGKRYCLHGDVSLRPVSFINCVIFANGIVVGGELAVRTRVSGAEKGWYDRGEVSYLVNRYVLLEKNSSGFFLVDKIKNCTGKENFPDWGYHIQLRPEPGAEFHVPSRNVRVRGGGKVPDDFKTWSYLGTPEKRVELGYIHSTILAEPELLGGKEGVQTVLSYPDGTGILTVVPQAPYFLTWHSSGGENSREFLRPVGAGSDPKEIFSKPWNGVGPEIGASPLDHDSTLDPAVKLAPLKSQGELELALKFEILSAAGCSALLDKIDRYRNEST